MKNRLLLLLSLSLLAGACAPEPSTDPDFDQEALTLEVLETLAGLTEAMNAGDPERVFSFYRQDPSFMYLGCTDVLFGWGTFEARVGPFYTFNPDVSFQQEVLSVQILGPTVAVAALRGSSTEAGALFWTEVLQKSAEGRWLITHEHESWPGCSEPRAPHMGTQEGEEGVPAEPSGQ